jgi:ubiquitin C-terminal hydrolase
MPEKPLTIATYAAGASLAAITLVYVFGPTFFIDDEAASGKKKSVVGLSNTANDCFINSVLQALAGLPDLRIYLIRETHRRKLDGSDVYDVDPEKSTESASTRPGKLEGLQKGLLTYGLKEILDSLNERPLYKKTISPQPFIRALERAFGTRISRQQQDAQEFLQIVTERLCDEYHAGTKARGQALRRDLSLTNGDTASERREIIEQFGAAPPEFNTKEEDEEDSKPPTDEEGFPFEGKIESQIECETCHFKPKPSASTFVTLTLNVPQVSSTSLNACFDGMLKVEYIDDFKCERCRLEHALKSMDHELSQATDEKVMERLQSDIDKKKTLRTHQRVSNFLTRSKHPSGGLHATCIFRSSQRSLPSTYHDRCTPWVVLRQRTLLRSRSRKRFPWAAYCTARTTNCSVWSRIRVVTTAVIMSRSDVKCSRCRFRHLYHLAMKVHTLQAAKRARTRPHGRPQYHPLRTVRDYQVQICLVLADDCPRFLLPPRLTRLRRVRSPRMTPWPRQREVKRLLQHHESLTPIHCGFLHQALTLTVCHGLEVCGR